MTGPEAMRKAMPVRDEAICELKKDVVILRTQQDELEQYSRQNSVRITGLPETLDVTIYDTVMAVFNDGQ